MPESIQLLPSRDAADSKFWSQESAKHAWALTGTPRTPVGSKNGHWGLTCEYSRRDGSWAGRIAGL